MTLLPMENRESILCALKCFEQEKPATIPPILEDYIKQISKNGQTMLPWVYVKPLLLHKYNKVVEAFIPEAHMSDFLSNPNQSHITELKQRVFKTFNRLDGIPFTIQRICELFENPLRHYKRLDKFLRGLEKVCMVVSTVDPEGNKIHREDPRLPSRAGLDDCSLLMNGSLNSSPTSPSLDNLQLQRAPKSSDEEATEEEDENEDDDAKDNSSDGSDDRGSSISPKGSCPQTLLGNTSPTSSWPFKAQTGGSPTSTPPSIHFRSPPMSKTRLIDQPLASPSSLMTTLSSNLVSGLAKKYQDEYDESDSLTPVNDLLGSTEPNDPSPNTFATLIHPDPSKRLTTESLGSSHDPIIHNPTILSNNCCSQITQAWAGSFDPISTTSSISPNRNDSIFPGITVIEEGVLSYTENTDGSLQEKSVPSNIASSCPSIDSLGRTNNRVSSPSSTIPINSPSDSVPPIMQVLRPIGQLEAFVQNMGSEVTCPTVEFSTTTTAISGSPKSDICIGQTTLTSPLFSPTADNDLEQAGLSTCSPTASPTIVGMRRPHSPTYEKIEHQVDDFTLNPVELEQSPAKRRRLTNADSSPSVSPKEGATALSLTSPPSSSALMDSPPVILCNPLNCQDSDEMFPQQSFENQSPIDSLTSLEGEPMEPIIALEDASGLDTSGPLHEVGSSDADQESIVESSSSLSTTVCTDSDTSKDEEEA